MPLAAHKLTQCINADWLLTNLPEATWGSYGPGGSSSKALGYGLDGPGVGGMEILLHSVSRLVLGSTQPPIK